MDPLPTTTREVEAQLQAPPTQYRPFVRWWWFGSALTREEIMRELTEMKNQGIGGAEIQPVYSAQNGHPLVNYPDVPWLSPEWVDLVAFAAETGKKLGMQVDLTFGNGWPFGGPYITKNLASTKLVGFTSPLESGQEVEIPVTDLVESPEALVIIAAVGHEALGQDPREIILSEQIGPDKVLRWQVPSGTWTLCWIVGEATLQRVKRATPGGEGLVLDHLNRRAFQVHADHLGGALQKKLGSNLGRHFGAFFCDSWEVFGENWTRNFLNQFKTRMGYDLRPHVLALYRITGDFKEFTAIVGSTRPKADEIVRRVVYDYRKVHGDLIIEEFFAPFAAYCHEVGVDCRVEPYIAPTDLLQAYGLLDICEIEGFGPHGISSNYYASFDPRIASSAAHVYQKKMVSCESFTWRGEHFSVSLEQLKQEADQILLHGVQRIVYHGFPISPPEAGNPGWVFYASVLANMNNLWWPYLHELNRYITIQAFLGHLGQNVADWAVYLPIHDEWSGKTGILKRLRQELRRQHWLNEFDYVNDDRILQAIPAPAGEEKTLTIAGNRYYGIVFWYTEYLPLEVLQRIDNLARAGAWVVFLGKPPRSCPGLRAHTNGDCSTAQMIINSLQASKLPNLFSCSDFEDFVVQARQRGYVPDVVIANDDPLNQARETIVDSIHYLHRQIADADLFFLVNGSGERFTAMVTFRARGTVERWTFFPSTQERLATIGMDQGTTRVRLPFQPYESCWVILRRDHAPPAPFFSPPRNPQYVFEVPSRWDVTFLRPANAFPSESEVEIYRPQTALFDWAGDPELCTFSGSAVYRTQISLNPSDLTNCAIVLNLGCVKEVAEVTVNGTRVAILWQGLRTVDISAAVKSGRNDIEVKVTNLLLNKIIGYEQRHVQWRPDYYFVNLGYGPFDVASMTPLSSGLLGPVTLEFYRREGNS